VIASDRVATSSNHSRDLTVASVSTIALDAMGGDHGPDVVVAAALRFLDAHQKTELILVGDEAKLTARLGKQANPRIRIHPTSQEVGMDELPSMALRSKKDSSMRVAIDLVQRGQAQACVSAGNTGALMATARYVLKTLPSVDRPAIITAVPSLHGHTHMLDLGANVDCTAEHLFQFAVMGSELVKAVEGVAKFVRHSLSSQFKRTWWTRLAGLAALPILKSFSRSIDPRRYNGASLLGLRGIVIKSHGGADEIAFENAIRIALKEIHADIPKRIGDQVGRHLSSEPHEATA
jgi:fatty acid/phospholipid biosynthesis enzyme